MSTLRNRNRNGKMPFLLTYFMTVANLLTIIVTIVAPAPALGGSSQNSYPTFKYEYPRPPSELGIPTLADPIPTGVIFSVANPIIVGPVSSQTFTNPNPGPHHYIFPTAAASSQTPVRVHPQSSLSPSPSPSPSSAPWRTSPKEKRSPLPMIAFDGDIYYDEAGSAELRLQPQDREQQHLESESESESEPKPGQQRQYYYDAFNNEPQENRQQQQQEASPMTPEKFQNFEFSDSLQQTPQQFNFQPQRNPSSNQPQHFQEQFDNQNGHDEYEHEHQEYEPLRNRNQPEADELVGHDTNHYNRYERDERGVGVGPMAALALGVGRTTPTTYRRVNSHRNRNGYRSRHSKDSTWAVMELEEPITMQSAVSVTKSVLAEFSKDKRIRHPWKYTQSIPLY